VWLGPGRFSTVLGVIFLVIVLASPGGLLGIWGSLRGRLEPRSRAAAASAAVPIPATAEPATTADERGGVA
jgi:branched-chain amino acid transport system permease protein